MLEKSDLMAIENLLDKKLDEKLDKRFAEQDRKFDEKFAEQGRKFDEKFAEQNKAIDEKLTNTKMELERMDLLLLDEIERNRNILEAKIDKVERDVNDMKQYYKVAGLEKDNTAMILEIVQQLDNKLGGKVHELDERVTRLEKRAMA